MAKEPVPASAALGQHTDHADISRGQLNPRLMSEDEKRAAGVSSSDQDVGPHDPTAVRGTGGSVVDTYGPGQVIDHGNVAGPTADLVMGQAPVVPPRPMRGSAAANEKVDMRRPNSINQSPVLRGIDEETGQRSEAPSFQDLADAEHEELDGKDGTVVSEADTQAAKDRLAQKKAADKSAKSK